MMRILSAIAAFSMFATGAFAADWSAEIVFPTWVSPPSSLMQSYSRVVHSQIAPTSGQVVVECRREVAGELDHCWTVSETPGGFGFGDAAQVIASLSDSASPPPTAIAPNGDVIIPINFNILTGQKDKNTSPRGQMITNPDWLTKPGAADLARWYPDRAQRRNQGGRARMICHVAATGALNGCRIISESPEGFGFGDAALAMARTFTMRPKLIDGQPDETATVIVPLRFALPNGGSTSNEAESAATPIWLKTPTLAQVAGAFPTIAGAETGRVVLICGATSDGRLNDCQVILETPTGRGFGDAAKSLAPDFQLKVAGYPVSKDGVRQVTVPITFYAPGAEKIDPITKPVWTRWIDRDAERNLLPQKAIEAGARSGTAAVDCILDHVGRLTQCQPITETPAGLGFGETAMRAAALVAIDPWTLQGRPVDGAHFHFSLTINLPPPAPPPPVYEYEQHPDWVRRPDVNDLAAAYPAGAQVRSGSAKLDCAIMASGYLGPCAVVSESPEGRGFGAAAMSLARIFAMRPIGPDGQPVAGKHIILPIILYAP